MTCEDIPEGNQWTDEVKLIWCVLSKLLTGLARNQGILVAMIRVAMWAAPTGWPHSPFRGPGSQHRTTFRDLFVSFLYFISPLSPDTCFLHLVLTLNLKPLSGQVLWHQRVHNAILSLLCQRGECTNICPWGPKDSGS